MHGLPDSMFRQCHVRFHCFQELDSRMDTYFRILTEKPTDRCSAEQAVWGVMDLMDLKFPANVRTKNFIHHKG